ncbi:MAG: AAA family ATPase [Desulfamplus sp.]|nr:AAA family ATPase [Desulfamplus sp.]
MSIWLLPRLELTPEQLRVVEMSHHEHKVILGPPGSGKTQVLIHRACHLSETYNLKPDQYRLFVFTNVVKEYIKSGIQFMELPEEVISTFDHWCRMIYEKNISKKLPWKSKSIDFDEVRSGVLKFYKENPQHQKQLSFVLVDEGQDLTPQVYEILSLVAEHITVFADPQQKIFENGASDEFILDKLGLKKCNASLLGAYRNAPYVAQLASCFIEDEQKKSQYLAQINTEQKIHQTPLCFVADNFDIEMDRLAEIISQRQVMNERIGIIVPTNKQLYGFTKGLEQRGVTVEKAVPRTDDAGCDFGNAIPKIATYYSAKGLTFDSVLLPRLTESSFSWIDETTRLRLFFVGISRATQWVYMSTVKGKEFSEIEKLHDAETSGHLTLQYTYDSVQECKDENQDDIAEDDFSLF